MMQLFLMVFGLTLIALGYVIWELFRAEDDPFDKNQGA
jgi:hypothetical protein